MPVFNTINTGTALVFCRASSLFMSSSSPFDIIQTKVMAELPVFSCSLLDHTDVLLLAKVGLQELRDSHPDSTPSNVMAEYMSPWKSHLLTEKLNPLIALVALKIKSASRQFFNMDLNELNFELAVSDCWTAVYEKTNYAIPHSHYPSDFSSVIYLDMEAESAPIVFNHQLVVKPAIGSLVFFPGLLLHHVPKTEGKRTIVAINYIKVPRIVS